MKPPEDLLARMRNDWFGIQTSVILLGAALQAKRGAFAQLENITDMETGQRVPAEIEALLKEAHRKALEDFRGVSAEELDHAIALYREHLKRNGLNAEWGSDN